MDNLTIEQFKHKILLRILWLRFLKEENKFNYQKLLKRLVYSANEILKEQKLDNLWFRFRGERIFLFYIPTNRIVFEVIIDGNLEDGRISIPDINFIDLKGTLKKSLTLNEIIADMEKKGKKGKYGKRNN